MYSYIIIHQMAKIFRHVIWIIPLVFMMSAANSQEFVPASFEGKIVRGVYWPWERTNPSATYARMEKWEFVDKMFDRIKNEWNCNAVWFVNGPDDPVRVGRIAEKYNVAVFLGTAFDNRFVYGLPSVIQADQDAKDSVVRIGSLKSLGAYVLKDEPKAVESAQMESYRRLLKVHDPSRHSLVVTMTGDTETYAKNTGFPVLCTDIYHFGGAFSPHIPNNPEHSKCTFRSTVEGVVALANENNKIPWCMPQAFAELWGPNRYDVNGMVILEPGCYWHWRMPSPAEISWQTWESLRSGCKGVIFFAILLGNDQKWDPVSETIPEEYKSMINENTKNGRPMIKERTLTNSPYCLTAMDGGSTPQSSAMALAFKDIGRIQEVVSRLILSEFPIAYAGKPLSVNSFSDPKDTQARYVIAVNDDISSAQEGLILVPSNVVSVQNIINQEILPSSSSGPVENGLKSFKLRLGPGGGCVLRMSFSNGNAGILLFNEAFNGAKIKLNVNNCRVIHELKGFGMGREYVVRKELDEIQDAWLSLDDFNSKKIARPSSIGSNLPGIGKSNECVYLKIDANITMPEDIVIQFKDQEGKFGWNKTCDFYMPIAIPSDATGFRIKLTNRGSIKRVVMWRAPIQ